MDDPVFIVTLVTLIVAVVAAWVSIKQLQFAREQAKQRPALEVVQIDWQIPSSVTERVSLVEDTRRKKKKEAEEATSSSLEEQLRQIVTEPGPRMENLSTPEEIETEKKAEDYSGELPDTALRIRLVNRGRVAASEITGWLYFDPAHLKPLQFFGGFEDAVILVYSDHLEHRVKVGGDKNSTLFPSPPRTPLDHPTNSLEFHVPVWIRPISLPVTTTVRYEFWTPMGHNIRDEARLQLTAEHKRALSEG